MEVAFDIINKTIMKSAVTDFRNFLKLYGTVTKWYVCSDYCIGDSKKNNDVISFVVFPHNVEIPLRFQCIEGLQPCDLKDTKIVHSDFCNYLQSGDFFSFNYMIDQDNLFSRWKDKTIQVCTVDACIQTAQKWQETTPNNAKLYIEYADRLHKLKQAMDQKSFNCKLMARVLMTTFLAGYIKYLLLEEHKNVQMYSWLSDRDDITTWQNGVYEIFYHMISHELCNRYLSDPSVEGKMQEIFVENKDKKQFYDPINRVADYICGVLADYNYQADIVSGNKQYTLIRNAISDNPYIVTIKISKHGASRILYTKSPSQS